MNQFINYFPSDHLFFAKPLSRKHGCRKKKLTWRNIDCCFLLHVTNMICAMASTFGVNDVYIAEKSVNST